MFAGVILDIDGVLVGDTLGFNIPDPHPETLRALKTLRKKGIAVILCTARPGFGIRRIVKAADLDAYHVTDGGGVLMNPLRNVVLKKYPLGKEIAISIVRAFLDAGAYTELYTIDTCSLQQDHISDAIMEKHFFILQARPEVTSSLPDLAAQVETTKIIVVAETMEAKDRYEDLFTPFRNQATLSWAIHPALLPLQFGVITAMGISKKQGVIDAVEAAGLSFDQILGVGDGTNDWQFIELCRYGAAMGNATDELKTLVSSKGAQLGFIGPSVSENGLIAILEHFS